MMMRPALPSRANAAAVRSVSAASLRGSRTDSIPSEWAAVSIRPKYCPLWVLGLNKRPARRISGTISLSRPSHLPPIVGSKLINPVRLPPGCARLATMPVRTGSAMLTKTTGTARVDFIDAVGRSLKEGRFLVLLAGDGIREDVQSLTELVNRTATKAFTFGVIEVAIYRFGKQRLAIQPRVLARTEVITRRMTILNVRGGTQAINYEVAEDGPEMVDEEARNATKDHLRAWWRPVLEMKFDDQEQEPPTWLVTNNVAIPTPFPGIKIKAWSLVDRKQIGVYMTGSDARLDIIAKMLRRDKKHLLDNLPKNTVIDLKHAWPIILKNEEALSDKARQDWLIKSLNQFANV